MDNRTNEWSWRSEPPIDQGVVSAGCAAENGNLYFLGGLNAAWNFSNYLSIFDPETGLWSRGANMPAALDGMGVQAYQGKLYMIGGRTSTSSNTRPEDTVYIYDIASNSWSAGATMPIKTASFACALLREDIYCIGGRNTDRTVYIYNIPSDSWRQGKSAPISFTYTTPGVFGDRLWLFNGWDESGFVKRVYIYDTVNDDWAEEMECPEELPELYFSVCTVKSKMYFCGGYTDGVLDNRCMCFDCLSREWSELPSMLSNRIHHASAVLADRIYCISGSHAGGKTTTPTVESLGIETQEPVVILRYEEEAGNQLRPSFSHYAVQGEPHTSTAAVIEGYACIGHRIDGGALQSGATATIPAVEENGHIITFVYRKEEDGGNPDPGPHPTPGGDCCCGCRPTLELKMPVCDCNGDLIKEVAEVLARKNCCG